MAKTKEPHICTAADPYDEVKHRGLRGRHPDAKFLSSSDGYPGGDLDHYRCPHCGKRFTVEVAQ